MEAIDSSFALVMQALVQQKQILDELDRENQELHRQLADLHAGVGISLNILSQQFSLAVTNIDRKKTLQIPALEKASKTDRTTEDFSPSPSARSLQEILMNEVVSADSNQMTDRHDPHPATQSSTNEEDEKAALRRQLMGSFLLE
jgi:hypothetical protein